MNWTSIAIIIAIIVVFIGLFIKLYLKRRLEGIDGLCGKFLADRNDESELVIGIYEEYIAKDK